MNGGLRVTKEGRPEMLDTTIDDGTIARETKESFRTWGHLRRILDIPR